jgi:(R,R)-butanediol dehydrogenase / meso-butanediol dehydrogenase / diacetyl reductase
LADVPSTMKAAVFHGRQDLRIEEVPTPVPREGELLLRVRAAGVCGTDAAEWERGPNLYALAGPHPVTGHAGPLIPGHELAGEVVGWGTGVDGFPRGTLVACGAGFVTAEDDFTRSGRPQLSSSYATVGLQANGGFAQYCAVPARACLPVGDELPSDATALAQPMAIAVHATRRGRLRAGERIVVIGVGGIGAFVVASAVETGAIVMAIDLDPSRLEIAASLGAARVVSATSADEIDELRSTASAIDAIFEATGAASGMHLALMLAPPGCRIVVVGLQAAPREIDLRLLSQREHELLGSNAHHCDADLPEALRVLAARAEGWDDIAPIAIPLEEIVPEGLLPLVERRADHVKTLVDPWASASRSTDTAPTAA